MHVEIVLYPREWCFWSTGIHHHFQLPVHMTVWQKHVLPANQNSKSWQSNFKLYLPTLEHFGTTPQTFEGKQSWSAMHSTGILCLEFWKSERMKLLLFIWMPTELSTEKHWLAFCYSTGANFVILFMTFFNTTALTSISNRESWVFYLGRGFFKFFSFSICFVTFRLFLLLFLD